MNIEQETAVDLLYTEFPKAFDIVPHKRLLSELSAYGIDLITIGLMEDFIK